MISRIVGFGKSLRDRVLRLPPAALIGLAALGIAGAAVAGVMLYRTYDYVQHDNDFCLSCHLMRDPFERFAQSAHRDLGCKACHQPTFTARSTMALTQIIEQPEELKTHAEVPNERCEECHVTGDPEKWEQISQTAGHRVHLNSDQPQLQGLTCVQCHSSSVHEFATTDKTCGQAECHETTKVRLGKMGQLTIHCASCHNFSAPVAASATADTLAVALRPEREECLSCHAMRRLVADFPENDPHAGACGACHNPHDQTTPQQAVQSCATAGCHERVDTITAFHRGLGPGVLTECTRCHTAHQFNSKGTSCIGCHTDIYQRGPITAPALGLRPASNDSLRFEHARHRNVECTQCHDTQTSHGGVTLTSFTTCQQCHHADNVRQTAQCLSCHERRELVRTFQERATVKVANRAAKQRQLRFNHQDHQTEQCTSCHTPGLEMSAANVSCTQCHQQHHRPETNCRACHTESPLAAHDTRAHVGCAGAQCHDPVPFQGVPRTRELCLSCHQNMVDHRPGRNCAQCHAVPGQRPAGAGRSGD